MRQRPIGVAKTRLDSESQRVTTRHNGSQKPTRRGRSGSQRVTTGHKSLAGVGAAEHDGSQKPSRRGRSGSQRKMFGLTAAGRRPGDRTRARWDACAQTHARMRVSSYPQASKGGKPVFGSRVESVSQLFSRTEPDNARKNWKRFFRRCPYVGPQARFDCARHGSADMRTGA